MVFPWTTVESLPSHTPVVFETAANGKLSLTDIVDSIDDCKDKFWYWTKFPLFNGHLQTMASSRDVKDEDAIYYGRRLFNLSDKGQISLDYALDGKPVNSEWEEDLKYKPQEDLPRFPPRTRYLRPEEIKKLDCSTAETRPLIIHLHGLSGGSHEAYLRSVVGGIQAHSSDFEQLVVTARGCNRTKITTPQLFNGLWTNDVREVVKHVKQCTPDRKIYIVGYSLGAAILANYLAQEGEKSQVDAAVCCAAPWDFIFSELMLQSSWMGQGYSRIMAQNLMRLVKNNKAGLEGSKLFQESWESVDGGKKIQKMVDFDHAFTAPLFGFESGFDYYRHASPVLRIHKIRTPLLILNSDDDPIVGKLASLTVDAQRNPYIHLLKSSCGGHLGWFGTNGYRWHRSVVSKFFKDFNDLDVQQTTSSKIEKNRYFQNDQFPEKLDLL